MELKQAIEMVEALLSDSHMGIDTLGGYADDVAITLYQELVRRSNVVTNNGFNLTPSAQVKQMLDGFFSSIPAYGDYTDTN